MWWFTHLSDMDTAVIAGVGPGFGEALARRLAESGYRVALFARSEAYLERFADELRSDGHEAVAIPTDITDPDQVAAGFQQARETFGPVTALAVMASNESGWDTLADLTPREFRDAWELFAFGTFLCAKEAAADMRDAGDGTILVTGATERFGLGEGHGYVSAAAGKRALAASLARELAPDVHVVHVSMDGPILNPDFREAMGPDVDEERFVDPDTAAEVCQGLIEQDRGGWSTSVDLRPPRDELDAVLEELL